MKYKRIAALAAAAALLTGCAEIPDRNMSAQTSAGTAEASGTADTAEVFDEIPAKQYPLENSDFAVKLNAEGERLTTDGKFGASTVAAVKRYQTRHSLTSDGSVGKDTWEKMFPAA